MRPAVSTLFLVLAVAFAAGCDDPAAPGESGGFRIRPDSAVITAGESMRFDVGGIPWSDAWGGPLGVEWKVLFYPDEQPRGLRDYREMVGINGWIRGLRAGSGWMMASIGELADTIDIRVVPGPAATVAIDWIAPRVWTGVRYGFPAVVRDRVGNRTEGEVIWTSETADLLAFAEDGAALPLDSGVARFAVALAGEPPSDTGSVLIVPFSGEWRRFGLGLGTSAMGVWCALDTGGRVSCEGTNEFGHLGIVTPVDHLGSGGQYAIRRGAPFGYPVKTDHLFVSVELGFRHICALGEDGLAYCWGERSAIGNQEGVEWCNGWPEIVCRFEPKPVTPDLVFLDITPSCGVTPTGDVWCWGREPVLALAGTPLRTLEGGAERGCGLSEEGVAYCWGENRYGQLGIGVADTLVRPEPVPIETEARFVQIAQSTHGGHVCGRTAAGELWCWGSNRWGQLGTEAQLETCSGTPDEEVPCAPSPVRVTSTTTFRAVDTGARHTCALAHAGTVYCWGMNHYGQISPDGSAPGDCWGGGACSRLPQPVGLANAATSLSLGVSSTCAGMVDGSFRCWGLIERRFERIEASVPP